VRGSPASASRSASNSASVKLSRRLRPTVTTLAGTSRTGYVRRCVRLVWARLARRSPSAGESGGPLSQSSSLGVVEQFLDAIHSRGDTLDALWRRDTAASITVEKRLLVLQGGFQQPDEA
jgi:hypothetical protein